MEHEAFIGPDDDGPDDDGPGDDGPGDDGLGAVRRARVAGEASGEPEPFDVAGFVAGRKGPEGPRPIHP